MDSKQNKYSSIQKIIFIILVIAVHSVVWAFVNNYNSLIPAADLYNLSSFFDSLFPYLGFSWFIYYSGHLYVIAGSTIAIWNYSNEDFRAIIFLFCLMIITGGIIQLILPAKSPLPEHMGYIHGWIHRNISNDPYVCFPSMHVSLSALPTFLLLQNTKVYSVKIILITVLVLIFVSTLTLKEHFFADAVSGLFLAYIFFMLFKTKTILRNKKDQKNEWSRSEQII